MLKRLCLALAGLFAFVSLAQGAGTVPGFSLTPQFDLTGKIMPGCKLFIIQAGTISTPQIAYQDSALTIPSLGGSTLTCDATGRLAQFFLADGLIKLRLTTASGTQVFVGDNLLVVGASSGGGGGGTVDPTTILTTGDIKAVYGTGNVTGFVRLNGRTIGSATSGATERANSDVQALFQYLWGADANLAVSGGRGISASADWAANKTIALPDGRGLALAGLDDMGNSGRGVFTGVTFSNGNATTLGSALGAARRTLTLGQLPAGITATGTFALSGSVNYVSNLNNDLTAFSTNAGGANQWLAWPVGTTHTVGNLTASGTVTSNNTSGQAFDSISPYLLITYYIKL